MHVQLLRGSAGLEEAKYGPRGGTVFDSWAWARSFDDRILRFAILDEGGEVVGGFHLFQERRLGFRILRNPPLTPSVGPWLNINASNPSVRLSRIKEVFRLVCEAIEAVPHEVISVVFHRSWTDMQPFLWRGFRVAPAYSYVIDLSETQEALWQTMSSDRRKSIKKAQKDAILIEETRDFERILKLVKMTFERQGQRLASKHVERVLFSFSRDDNSFARVAVSGGRDVACTYCVHDERTAYYLLGGYDAEHRHHGAAATCMWESIRRAHDLGLEEFDFEGSSVPPIERYFRGFGGALKHSFKVTKAWLPLEFGLRAIERRPR